MTARAPAGRAIPTCSRRLGLQRSDWLTHPLDAASFRFRNFKGFGGSGPLIKFLPISILVGRNNSGKSAVIDALEVVLSGGKAAEDHYSRFGEQFSIEVRTMPSETAYKQTFRSDVRSAGLQHHASDWAYGHSYVGHEVTRAYGRGWHPVWIDGPKFEGLDASTRTKFQAELARYAELPSGRVFRVAAERNVSPEPEAGPNPVQPNGAGLTNLVRAFLYDASLPMQSVEVDLLKDLNEIYRGDARFTRILSRRHGTGHWEIYLEEQGGQPVRLSQSGSSLKSIFIILATLRLNPIVEDAAKLENNVFCVEEPENNLHPSLLRRLLEFLAVRRAETNSSLLITTHSSAAIDWATRRDDAATYHVRRSRGVSSVAEAREYLALRDLLEDLDIRASEILQANGVIWVEGPSDRLYVRRWLDVASNGALREGVHYSIMFYGGKLLSHLTALPPAEAQQAISLLRLNRNLVAIIDSDRRWLKNGKFRADLNDTKRRIMAEAESVGGLVWLTAGKEIENYLSDRILAGLTGGSVKKVDKFHSVPDRLVKHVGDKISLAHEAAELTTEPDLDVLDLRDRIAELLKRVRSWNS
jgi:putative ATP-dependent endonuclease of the OLD family